MGLATSIFWLFSVCLERYFIFYVWILILKYSFNFFSDQNALKSISLYLQVSIPRFFKKRIDSLVSIIQKYRFFLAESPIPMRNCTVVLFLLTGKCASEMNLSNYQIDLSQSGYVDWFFDKGVHYKSGKYLSNIIRL